MLALLANEAALTQLSTRTIVLMVIVLLLLGAAQLACYLLNRQPDTIVNPAIVRAFNMRLRAYWMMCAILTAAFLFPGPLATVVLFFMISFWALREFITLTPTRMGDHRALFWVFFVFTPAQYVLVSWGIEFYEMYSIVVPVYGFLFIPARIALAGDSKRFLERAAKIQSGLLICVYALSFTPAILYLPLRDAVTGQRWDAMPGVLFFFILITQVGDLLQYAWGRFLGRHVIAPEINASRTWEGFFGGVMSTALVGAVLWWVTPFKPWQAALMSMVIGVMGFAGTMTMSAIKRDRGVKDYGTLVRGHAGVLDRIDSLCFAAPVFFHVTRRFFT
jgi:phosphatidate cytidylyltransferase